MDVQGIITLELMKELDAKTKGIGPVKLKNLKPDLQSPEEVVNFYQTTKKYSPQLKTVERSWERAGEIIEKSQENEIMILSLDDPYYPPLLKLLPDAPQLLHVKGEISFLQEMPPLALVGSRSASSTGLGVARELSGFFSRNGFCIVSGLAEGIDTAAHNGCLEAEGKTAAVLAHGLHTIYPPSNTELAERIVKSGGALISEYHFGTPQSQYRFVARDRIQSGLSLGVVIIESEIGGGAMQTAKYCENQKRLLYALDGTTSSGNQELLASELAKPLNYGNNKKFQLQFEQMRSQIRSLEIEISDKKITSNIGPKKFDFEGINTLGIVRASKTHIALDLNLKRIIRIAYYLYPYYSVTGDSYKHSEDKGTQLILDLKYKKKPEAIEYIAQELDEIFSKERVFVLCVVPSSEKNNRETGLRICITKLLSARPDIIDGRECLARKFDIPKKSAGGPRDYEKELESLELANARIIKGKDVVLIDDVVTTGCSLAAGAKILSDGGAKTVTPFAIGRTMRKGDPFY